MRSEARDEVATTDLVDRITGQLLAQGDAREERGEILFRCPIPGHADRRPSAHWNPRKGAWFCFPCNTGGGAVNLAERLGIAATRSGRRDDLGRRLSSRRYEIRDAEGTLQAIHDRVDFKNGKRVSWKSPDGEPGLKGRKVETLPLYGSERLRELPPGAPVIVTEGEKDCDALLDLGASAAGTVSGADKNGSKVHDRPALACLMPFEVVLWPDNDAPGAAHMDAHARRLAGMGKLVRTIEWRDAGPKEGAADFVKRGGSIEELRRLIEAAKPWEGEPEAENEVRRARLTQIGGSRRRRRPGAGALADLPDELAEESRESVVVVKGRLHHAVENVINVLARSDPSLYVRDGRLIRVCAHTPDLEQADPARDESFVAIDEVPPPNLAERISRHVNLKAPVRDDFSEIDPPTNLVAAIASRREYPGVRSLRGVTEVPLLRPDGAVMGPGYDPLTGFLFVPTRPVVAVTEAPTKEDAVASANVLLDVFSDFPLGDTLAEEDSLERKDSERQAQAVLLDMILTPLARAAFTGPAPGKLVDGNVPGVGKTTLARAASCIATGRVVPTFAYPDEQQRQCEIENIGTALISRGAPVGLLDNAKTTIGGAAFESLMTADIWESRVFHTKTSIRFEALTTWYVTSNNAAMSLDATTRVVVLRLVTDHENPTHGRRVKHADFLGYVRSRQPELTAHALTILRWGWLELELAKRRPDEGGEPGRFAGWRRTVARVIEVLGWPSPDDCQPSDVDDADTVHAAALLAAICEWRGVFDFAARDLAALCSNEPAPAALCSNEPGPDPKERAVRAAICDLLGEKPSTKRIGKALAAIHRRVIAGLVLRSRRDEHAKKQIWRVETMPS